MQSSQLGIGIVGTGMIAGPIADAIAKSKKATLTAVSSRRIENARKFLAERPGPAAVEGIDALLSRADVDAIYVATPTAAKEAIALAAIAAGKHVLVDKPFADRASVLRMTEAAAARNVAYMDATHFVHHPRTAAIRAASGEKIGLPRSLHTALYVSISDSSNIRFNPREEPMTALGDLAWYSMRAVVEYLRPAGKIAKVATVPERDTNTGAILRAAGLIAFESGEVSTFDIGHTAGTVIMELQLLGSRGYIRMDDFVLDWNNSFAFKYPEVPAGYYHRTGEMAPNQETFIQTPATNAQEVEMIDTFSELATTGDAARMASYAAASLQTMEYLDAVWAAAGA